MNKKRPKHVREKCKILNMKIVTVGVFLKNMLSVKNLREKNNYDVTIQVINLSSSEILLILCSYKIRYFSSLLYTILISFLFADNLKKICPWEW